MAEKETRNENLTTEEQSVGEAPELNEAEAEQKEPVTAAQEAAEEQPEADVPGSAGETPEGEPEEAPRSDEDPEGVEAAQNTDGKPKKERKLKWARSGGAQKQDPMEEKLNEINDRYARLFAEFDNFRKRSDKEKTQRYDFGVKDTVEKILPVIDNFERGLAAVPEEQAEDSFVTGMQMIYKQLMKALEDIGVKPIDAVGQEFDPDFHNAVMHVDDPEAGDNIIVEEFQKGYMYKDHVVRYSMVKVAN